MRTFGSPNTIVTIGSQPIYLLYKRRRPSLVFSAQSGHGRDLIDQGLGWNSIIVGVLKIYVNRMMNTVTDNGSNTWLRSYSCAGVSPVITGERRR